MITDISPLSLLQTFTFRVNLKVQEPTPVVNLGRIKPAGLRSSLYLIGFLVIVDDAVAGSIGSGVADGELCRVVVLADVGIEAAGPGASPKRS